MLRTRLGVLATCVLSLAVCLPASAAATFTLTGNMTALREKHSATLLPNGKVLIVSGFTGEQFDPLTGQFTATLASPNVSRLSHTATLLPNGKVLLVGGLDRGQATATAEIFDPATNTYTPTDSMMFARQRHTATLLPNGKVLIAGGTNGLYPVQSELYDPATGMFVLGGSLATGRYAHSATLLPNGKVLIAGGIVVATFTATAEIYDPALDSFSPTGSLADFRHSHTATLLPNGKVLMAGGFTGVFFTTVAELYDPATGMFTQSGTAGFGRIDHTATLLPSGKVLITGGGGSAVGFVILQSEIYDPATGTFSGSASMSVGRDFASATLLPDGRVLVAGGFNPGPGSSLPGEIYESTTPSSVATSAMMATGRFSHTSTLLPNGKVLVVGGFNEAALTSGEIYDPVADSFTPVSNTLLVERNGHTATLLSSGLVLIAGGFLSGSLATNTAVLYDPATNAFRATGNMVAGRSNHTATLLADGRVLLAGGLFFSAVNSAEIYNPATETFSVAASMATPRYRHQAALLPDGRVLVAGGQNSGFVNSAEIYDPAGGTAWTTTDSMDAARVFHTVTLLPSGKVLVAGGFDGAPVTGVEMFDPATAMFSTLAGVTLDRRSHTATQLPDGKVLIAGGTSGAGFGLPVDTTNYFDPATNTLNTTAPLSTPRSVHTATLLLDGTVALISGGNNFVFYVRTVDRFDRGISMDARRPSITSAPSITNTSTSLTISGVRFLAESEGHSGNTFSSDSRTPFVRLQRLNDGRLLSPRITDATQTTITTDALPAVPPGYYLVTVITSGLASESRLVLVTDAPAPTITGVSPSMGSSNGGELVTINGTNLGAASVIVGGAGAVVTSSSPTSLQISTPPHVPGLVDVVLSGLGGTATAPASYTYFLGKPLSFSAFSLGSTVQVTWSDVPGAASYEVERSVDNTTFTVIAPDRSGEIDSTTAVDAGYLYRVRAFDSSGNPGPYSNLDHAATITFVDDPIVPGVTPIKADHVHQIRTGIKALYSTVTTFPLQFTDPVLVPGTTPVKAEHVAAMQGTLLEFLAFIGMPRSFTEAAPGSPILAAQITELRNALK